MHCNSVANILDLYTERRLTEFRMVEVEAHLGRCKSCSRKADSAGGLSTLLAGAQGSRAPKTLKENLLKALSPKNVRMALPPSPAHSFNGEAAPVLAAAALYACLAILGYWIGPGVPSQQIQTTEIDELWRVR